jgi:hypothetical protein
MRALGFRSPGYLKVRNWRNSKAGLLDLELRQKVGAFLAEPRNHF